MSESGDGAMTGHNSTEAPSAADVAAVIGNLGNADIAWDATYVGPVPTIVGESARRLLARGEVIIPQLVDAMEDEYKFVAAHVLLTMLSDVEYGTTPWNGLEIELSPDGRVRFDTGQRRALASRWRAWTRATPRPRSLNPE